VLCNLQDGIAQRLKLLSMGRKTELCLRQKKVFYLPCHVQNGSRLTPPPVQ
jgi:hypothetical protein